MKDVCVSVCVCACVGGADLTQGRKPVTVIKRALYNAVVNNVCSK